VRQAEIIVHVPYSRGAAAMRRFFDREGLRVLS
jgi:hypothetical protein